MRPIRAALAVAALAAIVGLRAASSSVTTIPLITIPQGVGYHEPGGEPVFVLREGSVVTAFRGYSPASGERIVYCPGERAFVAPTDQSLWTERGEWVGGPATRDLDRLRVVVDPATHLVRLDPGAVIRAKGRSRGEVSGEVGERYSGFRAGIDADFCLNPVPASAVPSSATASPTPS